MTNITPTILSEQLDFINLQQDSQDIFYSEQFQNQEEQFPTLQNIQQDINLPQHIRNPSETAPIQNVSEPSDITIPNPQSITITNDSNILQTVTNQNPNTTDSNQDRTSTVLTSDTNVTSQLQTQQPSPRNYDPPSIPPQYATQPLSNTSPQSSSFTQATVSQNLPTIQYSESYQNNAFTNYTVYSS